MLLGAIADDFTGASDLANTLARGGMAVTQLVGVPQGRAPDAMEAGVVSLKTRSIAPEAAVRQSLDALAWLSNQGCRQYLFKYCSTFDSTPSGNIGPVAEALSEALSAKAVVVCPAFPTNGRTVYQGHLFVKDRLLSESGMERHPLNPMTDPDIRRWLGRQTTTGVGHVPYEVVQRGSHAIAEALAANEHRLVVVDAVSDGDLLAIGHAVRDAVLVTGGSGIALGLPQNFRQAGLLADRAASFRAVDGPAVILSGSCSNQSRIQLAHHLERHPGLAIRPEDVFAGELSPDAVAEDLWSLRANSPIAYSTAPQEVVDAARQRFGGRAALALEQFFGELASKLLERGIARLVIGGGETAGAVINAIGIEQLEIGPEIDPGVPAMTARYHGRIIGIALKSGNFGAIDFYERAIRILGEEH
jgi:3-dehydrotetronate 4-kinase